MRRFVFSVMAASGLLLTTPSSAFAEDPAPIVSAPSAPGKKLCKVTDPKLDELSGIVATETGFAVINDGTDKPDRKRVFFLDTKCKIVDEVSYSGRGPADTEDMVLSPDGKTLWIADIGDNDYEDEAKRRPQIALWSMPVSGDKRPTLHRLKYPAGDFHNAEALLIDGKNQPLIITKEVGKPAGIYQPTGPLEDNNTEGVPLKRVGQITVSGTTTTGQPAARIGNKTISGGAVAPDAARVALRTYTDALEWDVTGGDVLGALLNGKPRTTGLPNEPFGEAITYSADGKTFYTVSDVNGVTDTANYIQQYTPATTVAKAAPAANGGGADGGKKWYADLSIDDITYAVGGVGVLGLLLVGAGVLGIVRHRKRLPPTPAEPSTTPKFSDDGDPETELIGVGGPGAARSGPVYGAKGGRLQYAQAASGPVASGPVASGPITSGPIPAGAGGVYGAGKGAAGGAQSGPGARAPQGGPGQPGRPPQGPNGRPPQDGRPADAQQPRNPQGPPPRGPQGQPSGPQGQPSRGPQQGQAQRGAQQGQPARGPQQGRPGGGAQQGQRGGAQQGQPSRGAQQGQPARGPQQGQPARGAQQGQPGRGQQQGQPGRGAQQGQRGGGAQQGQPGRGPQQGQTPRDAQGQPSRGPQQGGAQQGQPARGSQQSGPQQGQPARGQQSQPPRGPQGQPARQQTQPSRGPQQSQPQPVRGQQRGPSHNGQGQGG